MAASEDSGVFDVGAFDNAQFDTIEQPSTVNVFSQETASKTLNKFLSSTVNVFSDLGKEVQRDLTSFVSPVQSVVDAQRNIIRRATSFSNVFSQTDFRLGKKVISTINAASATDSTISIIREPVSTIKSVSQVRTIFELTTVSNVKVFSRNEFDRIFNRFTESTLKVQSEIKDILRSAPDLSPPFTVDVKQSYRTFVNIKQSFKTFIKDNT